jgi:transposase
LTIEDIGFIVTKKTMIQIEFTKKEVESLYTEKANNANAEIRRKAEALYLKSLNFTHTDIQQATRISRTTLSTYLKSYKKGGLKWVLANNHHSPTSELDEHKEELKKYFELNPLANSKEAGAKIKDLTTLSRSPTQIREFLKRIGMKFRKIGFVPGQQTYKRKWKPMPNF